MIRVMVIAFVIISQVLFGADLSKQAQDKEELLRKGELIRAMCKNDMKTFKKLLKAGYGKVDRGLILRHDWSPLAFTLWLDRRRFIAPLLLSGASWNDPIMIDDQPKVMFQRCGDGPHKPVTLSALQDRVNDSSLKHLFECVKAWDQWPVFWHLICKKRQQQLNKQVCCSQTVVQTGYEYEFYIGRIIQEYACDFDDKS